MDYKIQVVSFITVLFMIIALGCASIKKDVNDNCKNYNIGDRGPALRAV